MPWGALVEQDWGLDGLLDVLGHLQRGGGIGTGQQHHKLAADRARRR